MSVYQKLTGKLFPGRIALLLSQHATVSASQVARRNRGLNNMQTKRLSCVNLNLFLDKPLMIGYQFERRLLLNRRELFLKKIQ